MDFRCSIGLHRWDDFAHCRCKSCGQTRDKGPHHWVGCICTYCEKVRDEGHDWSYDCQECKRCKKRRSTEHKWVGCRCQACRRTRDVEHSWVGCRCQVCGQYRDQEHDWRSSGSPSEEWDSQLGQYVGKLDCAVCHARCTKPSAVTAPLIALFAYPNPDEQGSAEGAAEKLVRMGAAAVGPLIHSLRETGRPDEPRNPSHAISALVRIGEPAVEGLIRALHNAGTRNYAELVLVKIGVPTIKPLINNLSSNPFLDGSNDHLDEEVAHALGKIGVPAVGPLIEVLTDNKSSKTTAAKRAGAVRALGYIGDAQALKALIGALRDASAIVRHEAVSALVRLRDSRACEPLRQRLDADECFSDRLDIIGALRQLGDTRADELLIAQLRMSDASGEAAIRALEQLGKARAVEPMISLLGHEKLGAEAARLLGTLGDSRAVEPLMVALSSSKGKRDFALELSTAMSLLQLGDLRGVPSLLWARSDPSLFFGFYGNAILQFGAKHHDELVALLRAELKSGKFKSRRNRFAAELLCLLGEPPATRELAAVILDWIEVERKVDDGLKMMTTRAGLDAAVISLGADALGNTYRTESGSSSGGNFNWRSVGAHDMSSVLALCQRDDILSSCFLYRVARKQDFTVTMSTCAPSTYEVNLSFEEERLAARHELTKRGFGESDPLDQL